MSMSSFDYVADLVEHTTPLEILVELCVQWKTSKYEEEVRWGCSLEYLLRDQGWGEVLDHRLELDEI